MDLIRAENSPERLYITDEGTGVIRQAILNLKEPYQKGFGALLPRGKNHRGDRRNPAPAEKNGADAALPGAKQATGTTRKGGGTTMKELFDPNGHLTDDAFGALLRDEPARRDGTSGDFRAPFLLRPLCGAVRPPSWTAPSCSLPRAGRAPVFRRIRERAVSSLSTNTRRRPPRPASPSCSGTSASSTSTFRTTTARSSTRWQTARRPSASGRRQFTDNLSETLDKILQSLKIERGSQHEKE